MPKKKKKKKLSHREAVKKIRQDRHRKWNIENNKDKDKKETKFKMRKNIYKKAKLEHEMNKGNEIKEEDSVSDAKSDAVK